MEHKVTEIQSPIIKAVMSLTGGVGTSVGAKAAAVSAFLPNTLAEWIAAGSATVAFLYSTALFIEWLYKKIFLGGFGK